MIEEILAYNRGFVEGEQYSRYATNKFPDKRLAIISCMDTRLTELLPAALGLRNGDAKFIKNAGGIISHPFGSVMRSLIIAIYELNVSDIMVIAHSDCGACHTDTEQIRRRMNERGVTQQSMDLLHYCGVDFDTWLQGFGDTEHSVKQTVKIIKENPLIPKDIRVLGFVIDSHTGRLDQII